MAIPTIPRGFSGVYAIRNAISGRVYVGSSLCVKSRWATHRSALVKGKHHAPLLQKSWTKHGPGAFSFEVLEAVDDPANLLPREQHWINILAAFDWKLGFNGRPAAGSPRGIKRSPEWIGRMKARMTGRKKTPEHAAKVAIARDEGHRRWVEKLRTSPEARAIFGAKLSALRKGRKISPEGRINIGLAKRGVVVSSETRAKQSRAQKARYHRDPNHPLKESTEQQLILPL
jgi:group I intron endonuclease